MVRRRIPPNPKHMWRPPPPSSAEQAFSKQAQALINLSSSTNSSSTNSSSTNSSSTNSSSTNSSSTNSSSTNSSSNFLPLKISTLKDFTPMLPFITAYGPKTRVLLSFPEQPFGRTKQAFRQESDINNIVAQFLKTGTLEFTRKHEAQYGDVTGADFQTAMNTITAANSMFAELPAKLRSRFENDPAKFLDFVQDENNREEASQLGLLKPTAPGATPLAPQGAQAAEQPQNRTQDGRFTFDNPPSGPKGDGKTNSNT